MIPPEALRFVGLALLCIPAVLALYYPLRKKPVTGILVASCFTFLAAGGYVVFGSGMAMIAHEKAALRMVALNTMMRETGGADAVIARLRTVLASQPDSAKGWYLLGRLYASQGRHQEAVDAFAKAHAIAPQDTAVEVNLLKSQWQAQGGTFTQSIQNRLETLLKASPDDPNILSLLAIGLFVRHDYERAIALWQRLLTQIPPESSEATALKDAIRIAREARNERQGLSGD